MLNKRKKINIVCRTFYPSQSPRSNRAMYLAIELANRGYDVKVYSLLGKFNYLEFQKKYNLKIINLGKSRLGNGDSDTGKQSNNFLFRITRKLFGRFILFPEVEIMYLIFKKRKEILNSEYIISIAAPFTIHFGVGLIKKQNQQKWISDCGDPFTLNPHSNYPFYFKFIENWWAKKTDYITIPILEARSAYPEKYIKKVCIIPQGFPIINQLEKNYTKNKITTFCYSGTVYKGLRDPTRLLEYLTTLKFDFRFIIYTKTNELFLPFQEKLGKKLILKSHIPREDLLIELSKMDFLINIQNKSSIQAPSKLIDYAMSKRPIIEITSNLLPNEKIILKDCFYHKFPKQNIDLEKYNIENVAKQFIDLLEN